ncbi:MAG: hypothetical protein JNK81_16610 [Anaerolineales bacterium]|nr:hypothetical protein [Anaerolineales bacterium]
MKKNTFIYVIIVLSLIVSAFAFLNRIYLSQSEQSNDITVNLQWISYDAKHVAIEYDVNGLIETSQGNYFECPVGNSVVLNSNGEDITGETFISCRFVSEGQYHVTQFFYNDFQNNVPGKVEINIGDKVFFSHESGKEVYIPVLQTINFDLPKDISNSTELFSNKIAIAESGLDMVVSQANFTPRLAKVDACITLPDNGDWGIDAYVKMSDEKFTIDYWQIPNFREPEVLQNKYRCFTTVTSSVSDFRNLQSGDISFVVNKVYRNMPDCTDKSGFEKIKGELESYGINLEPDPAGYYCFTGAIMDLGDAESNAHLFTYIREALKEEVEGPLTITIK